MDVSARWEMFLAALAIGAAVWSRMRVIWSWLRGFVVTVARCEFDVAMMVTAYLERERPARSRDRVYRGHDAYVRPLGRSARVIAEWRPGGSRWLRYRGRPLYYSAVRHSGTPDPDGHAFSFLRGSLDWEALLVESAAWWSGARRAAAASRFAIHYHQGAPRGRMDSAVPPVSTGNENYFLADVRSPFRVLGWRPEDIGRAGIGALDSLALPTSTLAVVEEIRRWFDRAAWYRQRQIAHRRGYLFQGPPGTGKTSLVRAIAIDLGMPIHVFDLATLSNQELRSAWRMMAADAPCIALVEDIDGVFRGRERVSDGDLTFDALLNVIDGVDQTDGILLTITTNHPEHVDPALIDRARRVDRVVELEPLGPAERLAVAIRILGNTPRARDLATAHEGSPAALVEACCRLALEDLYASDERAIREPDADDLPIARTR